MTSTSAPWTQDPIYLSDSFNRQSLSNPESTEKILQRFKDARKQAMRDSIPLVIIAALLLVGVLTASPENLGAWISVGEDKAESQDSVMMMVRFTQAGGWLLIVALAIGIPVTFHVTHTDAALESARLRDVLPLSLASQVPMSRSISHEQAWEGLSLLQQRVDVLSGIWEYERIRPADLPRLRRKQIVVARAQASGLHRQAIEILNPS